MDGNEWKTEDEEVATEQQPVIEELSPTPSKVDLFKQAHPGAYTSDDLKALKVDNYKDHHRVWLVLVDSNDTEDWGVVEDTLGNLLWEPGKGEVVGTWTRSRLDNRIHLSLMSAINALEDRSITIWERYAQERRVQKAAGRKPRALGRKDKVEEPEPVPGISIEEKMRFNSLRAKLKRAKG